MAGEIATEQLADDIIAASANGRAKVENDFFDAATALAKFATDSFDNAAILKAIPNGAFIADVNTRALFAAGFINTSLVAAGSLSADAAGRALVAANFFDEATLTSAIAADAITAAVWAAKAAAGAIGASADGRASIATGFFDATTVADKFASGAVPQTNRGAAMRNRINLATVPANAETITIGADVFEFRSSTPPANGTAGRIWVYEGGGVVATARTNLVNAINNTTDVPNITYNGAVVENFTASESGADVSIVSSTDAGTGTTVASATATACSDGLGAAADVWDQATCYGGRAETTRSLGQATVTLVANMITNASVRVSFPFTPTGCILVNRSRPQNEAVTIVGTSVNLALAGGAAPNNQAGDVIDVVAWGA